MVLWSIGKGRILKPWEQAQNYAVSKVKGGPADGVVSALATQTLCNVSPRVVQMGKEEFSAI